MKPDKQKLLKSLSAKSDIYEISVKADEPVACKHGVEDGACKECYEEQTKQEPVAWMNTDKIIWRGNPDDYYTPSIFVTEQNNIGISVGGLVYVKPIEEWHKLANTEPQYRELSDEEIKTIENSVKYSELALWHDEYMTKFARAILKKASEK